MITQPAAPSTFCFLVTPDHIAMPCPAITALEAKPKLQVYRVLVAKQESSILYTPPGAT